MANMRIEGDARASHLIRLVLILTLFVQRYLVTGLTLGATGGQ